MSGIINFLSYTNQVYQLQEKQLIVIGTEDGSYLKVPCRELSEYNPPDDIIKISQEAFSTIFERWLNRFRHTDENFPEVVR